MPDVTGQTERPATLVLRRLQLEVGTIAHLPAPSPAGIVLAQSPPPNAIGLNGPRVALLVSDDTAAPDGLAFVMPSITGMTLSAASLRLATAGLHIASAAQPEAVPDPAADPTTTARATPAPTPAPEQPMVPAYVAPQAVSVNATITSQSPAAGHRVTRADAIRVMLSH